MPKKQSRAGASPSSPTCGMEPVASPPSLFLVSRDRKPEPAQCPLLRVLWSLWVYRVSSKASRDTPGPAGLRGWKGRQNEKTRLNTLLPKPQRAHTQFFIFGFLQRKYFIDKGSHWRLSSRSLLTLMLWGRCSPFPFRIRAPPSGEPNAASLLSRGEEAVAGWHSPPTCLWTLVSCSRLFSRKEIFCFWAALPPPSSLSSSTLCINTRGQENQPPNCPPAAPASCGRAILNIPGKKSPILLKVYSENENRGSRSWDSTVFPINSLYWYQTFYFLDSWPKILQSTFERYRLDTVLFVNIPLPCR